MGEITPLAILLGKKLYEERKRLGMSQEKFGECCNSAARTVIEWEKGNSFPTLYQLNQLSMYGLDLNKFTDEVISRKTIDRFLADEIVFDSKEDFSLHKAMHLITVKFAENPTWSLINFESINNSDGANIGIRYYYKLKEALICDEAFAYRDALIKDFLENR